MTGNYSDRLDGYVDVAERIRLFRDRYPEGSLQPANLATPWEIVTIGEKTFLVYIAAAYRHPDDPRPGIGMAWEPFPGRTPYTKDSELMVAETSAWGRAIKAALLDDRSKVASLDEVRARRTADQHPASDATSPVERRQGGAGTDGPKMASDAAKRFLRTLAKERGYELPDLGSMTARDAYDLTEKLKALPKAGDEPEEAF
jgi:hypothetical protein